MYICITDRNIIILINKKFKKNLDFLIAYHNKI